MMLVLVVLFPFLFPIISPAPIPNSTIGYLLRFGYLSPPGNALHSQLSDARVQASIIHLQKFAHLPVTGLIDTATLQLLQKPRYGVPDFMSGTFSNRHRRFVLQGQKWEKDLIYWSFDTSSVPLDSRLIHTEIRHAFSSWSDISKIRFQESAPANADILIRFGTLRHGDHYVFDGEGGILGHAFFPGSGLGGDVHLDGDEIWFTHSHTNQTGTNIYSVLLHEIGHSLGLAHSDVESAVMYPWYRQYNYGHKPSRDDHNALQVIYGSPNRFAPNPHFRPVNVNITTQIIPSLCSTTFDIVTNIRGNIFFFKDIYYFRYLENGFLDTQARKIRGIWPALPSNLTKLDAVYSHNYDVFIFIGEYFWRFEDAIFLHRGSPEHISSLSIPWPISSVSSAVYLRSEEMGYLFSGNRSWPVIDTDFKLQYHSAKVLQFPAFLSRPINSVFQYNDSLVLLVVNRSFFIYNLQNYSVTWLSRFDLPFFHSCTPGIGNLSSSRRRRKKKLTTYNTVVNSTRVDQPRKITAGEEMLISILFVLFVLALCCEGCRR